MTCEAVVGRNVTPASAVSLSICRGLVDWERVLFPVCFLTELQKEEAELEAELEAEPREGHAPSFPAPAALDASHPYYDVARHGIIQVCGQ